MGEFTAQFMSYTYAQKTSKRPEDFGHGSSEGLIAAETANNAVPAAAMIPLLALGIPGEALTAMMLSVFYVHNVMPGPQLFQNDMDFVVALYLALLLLNVLVLVFLLVATNQLIKVVKIPNRFLGVAILTLSFVGVYSLRNSFTDCIIAAGFGVLGFILKRLQPADRADHPRHGAGRHHGGEAALGHGAGEDAARFHRPPDRRDPVCHHPSRAGPAFPPGLARPTKKGRPSEWSTSHASTSFATNLSRRKAFY